MNTLWNFSAGPSKLPTEVLQQAAAEMLDWHGSGMSVMEMSHRGPEFTQICDEAEEDLRLLLNISDDYAVMFMQGGATAQNAIVPMNLLNRSATQMAAYVLTGIWSNKSYKEAARYGAVQVAASNRGTRLIDGTLYGAQCWVPEFSEWQLNPQSAYLHYCSNETIGGLEISGLPDMVALGAADVPLVIDASSHFLSRPLEVNKTAVVYAGAQKNAGPGGVTIVIARRDLFGQTMSICPSAFDFANVAAERSRFNTPPCYSIYICGLVFKWLLQQGGVSAIESSNITKAQALYEAIDSSDFYSNKIAPVYRSRMNVPFVLADERLNSRFLEAAQERRLSGLKGHKSVGGMRASIYNAMPLQGVHDLIDFLKDFEQHYG